jgi:hypothetical protein
VFDFGESLCEQLAQIDDLSKLSIFVCACVWRARGEISWQDHYISMLKTDGRIVGSIS